MVHTPITLHPPPHHKNVTFLVPERSSRIASLSVFKRSVQFCLRVLNLPLSVYHPQATLSYLSFFRGLGRVPGVSSKQPA